ncbi:hypothetical protein CJ468_06422 [Nocardia farcinica]|nr:hypothetical protein CJ468_06422 [Nocardia farcinica]
MCFTNTARPSAKRMRASRHPWLDPRSVTSVTAHPTAEPTLLAISMPATLRDENPQEVRATTFSANRSRFAILVSRLSLSGSRV